MRDTEIWRKGKMFNAIKFKVLHRRTASVCVVVLFAAVMVLLPISARAQCEKWDVSGPWETAQDTGLNVQFRIQQQGDVLTGTGTRLWSLPDQKVIGSLKGSIRHDRNGDKFFVAVTWPDNTKTSYTGTIDPQGWVGGDVDIRYGPYLKSRWHSAEKLKCAPSTRVDANATFQPGLGGSSLLKGPSLAAGQAIFPYPGAATGFAVLTWDAGPAHPNADLWVSYNNSRERVILMKSPKGGMQAPVQRGMTYSYILMDGRIVLATATVVAY